MGSIVLIASRRRIKWSFHGRNADFAHASLREPYLHIKSLSCSHGWATMQTTPLLLVTTVMVKSHRSWPWVVAVLFLILSLGGAADVSRRPTRNCTFDNIWVSLPLLPSPASCVLRPLPVPDAGGDRGRGCVHLSRDACIHPDSVVPRWPRPGTGSRPRPEGRSVGYQRTKGCEPIHHRQGVGAPIPGGWAGQDVSAPQWGQSGPLPSAHGRCSFSVSVGWGPWALAHPIPTHVGLHHGFKTREKLAEKGPNG